jgi:RNA recognition motif-containing protein
LRIKNFKFFREVHFLMSQYTKDIDKNTNLNSSLKMNINFYQNNNDLIKQDLTSNTFNMDNNKLFQNSTPNSSQYSVDLNLNNENFITSQQESYNYSPSFSTTSDSSSTTSIRNSSDVLNKVFLGGLNYKTDEQGLKDYFSQYGSIVDCVVIRDAQTKRSRGFGFVKYAEPFMVDELMKNRPHKLDGRELDIKRSVPLSDSKRLDKHSKVNKLFVGGINDSINENDLKEYFSRFGNILNLTIKRDKTSLKSRGFGFVVFDDYDPVDKILLMKNHSINSVKINVEKAQNDSALINKIQRNVSNVRKNQSFSRRNISSQERYRNNNQPFHNCPQCLQMQMTNHMNHVNPTMQNSSMFNNQIDLNATLWNKNDEYYGSYNLANQNLVKDDVSTIMNKVMSNETLKNAFNKYEPILSSTNQSLAGPVRNELNRSHKQISPYSR